MTNFVCTVRLPGLFVGRVRQGTGYPLVATVRDGMVFDITLRPGAFGPWVATSASFDDPAGMSPRPTVSGRRARRDRRKQLRRRPRSIKSPTCFLTRRPSGGEGFRRHLRRQPAGTRHRGAGARLADKAEAIRADIAGLIGYLILRS